MKKKLLPIVFVLTAMFCMIAAPGCTAERGSSHADTAYSALFNDETYVWQDFMFPTNRTSGRQ